MSTLKKPETLTDLIKPLGKESLKAILLKKEGDIFKERNAKEKYEMFSIEQLQEKIIESFESGHNRFDMMYAALLNDYLNSETPDEYSQHYVDSVIEEFNLSIGKYEGKRRHEIIDNIYDGENSNRLEILDYISELIREDEISGEELSDTEHQLVVDLIFMYVIFEILYTTEEVSDFFSRKLLKEQYIKKLLGETNE